MFANDSLAARMCEIQGVSRDFRVVPGVLRDQEVAGSNPVTPTSNPQQNPQSPQGAAQNPAHLASGPQEIDPDLAEVTAAWPTLPAALRAGILAMVRAAKP